MSGFAQAPLFPGLVAFLEIPGNSRHSLTHRILHACAPDFALGSPLARSKSASVNCSAARLLIGQRIMKRDTRIGFFCSKNPVWSGLTKSPFLKKGN
jgi:hypothetical protein